MDNKPQFDFVRAVAETDQVFAGLWRHKLRETELDGKISTLQQRLDDYRDKRSELKIEIKGIVNQRAFAATIQHYLVEKNAMPMRSIPHLENMLLPQICCKSCTAGKN